jgi:outer membrane lipoprotein-sorting protein
VAITFLYGKGDLRRDFTATLDGSGTYGTKSDYVLELVPKKPSAQYKTLFLVVDPGNFRVKQSIVVEASGNTNHFKFFEPNTDKQVKDSWFFFNEKKFKGKYRLVKINKKEGAR